MLPAHVYDLNYVIVRPSDRIFAHTFHDDTDGPFALETPTRSRTVNNNDLILPADFPGEVAEVRTSMPTEFNAVGPGKSFCI